MAHPITAARPGIDRRQVRRPPPSYHATMDRPRDPASRTEAPRPAVALEDKVRFLSDPRHLPGAAASVEARETHMSWVFLTEDRVYKLKKPVRFPYLDFSTLARREAACRAELRLNRRLAPDVYLDVVPLVKRGGALAIGGAETPVDWLVMMKRLDVSFMLDRLIGERQLTRPDLDRLAGTLARFYRAAQPVFLSPTTHLADWRKSFDDNKRVLLDARFHLPAGIVYEIDRVQRRFLAAHGAAIAARLRHRRVVDAHGDLRPEHIWLGDRVSIIDCLEFNDRLRINDPFDEVAFLSLECERLGAPDAGDYLWRRMKHLLRDGPADELFAFYRCHRATLRARLAIAHLYEEHARTPEKWPRLCMAYLGIAARGARQLEQVLRRPSGR